MKPKHVPQRTCVGCRTTSAKRAFIRVVRTPEDVVVDESGKQNGRGAYLCANRACWEDALKKDRLARALRTAISREDAEALHRYAEGLAQAVPAGS